MSNVTKSKSKCYHCKFAGDRFSVAGKTHVHCENRELYPEEKCMAGEVDPWETLREWWDTCDKFEPKS